MSENMVHTYTIVVVTLIPYGVNTEQHCTEFTT
jgi:hypothetical protein